MKTLNRPSRLYPFACAAFYFLAAKASLLFVFESHHVATVWIPNGVLVGLLWPAPWRKSRRTLGLAWVANALANFLSGNSLSLCGIFATVNVLEVFICLRVLSHFRVYTLTSTRRILIFLATTTFTAGVIAALGSTWIAYPRFTGLADSFRLWHTADAWGLWAAVPIVHRIRLRWGRTRRAAPKQQYVLILATLGAVVISVMTDQHSLLWLPLLIAILLWTVFRFGPSTTSIVSCAYTVALIWATAHGKGPFVDSDQVIGDQIFDAQVLLGSISVGALIAATIIRERERLFDALKQTQTLLKASIERFSLAVKGSQNGIWDWNLAAQKIYFSPPWKQMLGYEDHELANTISEWEARLHPEDMERVKAELERAIAPGGQEYSVEFRMRHRDGSYRWILARAFQVRDAHGKTRRMIGSHLDISEYKRIQAELKTARDQATHAAHVKSEFLANMSHEIRTPLNGIVGIIDLLAESSLTEEQRQHMGVLKRSTDTLRYLINDVLDFSKIEAGKLTVESVPFSLQEWTSDTIELFMPAAKQRSISLNAQLDPQIPERIMSDPARYRQVLSNLVSNALKFTPHGFVNVRVDMEEKRENTFLLHVRVMDSGIGIPVEKQGTLFHAFSQADTSTTRRFGGTGLGLAISARLVELLGGRIWVESSDHGGSTFHFTWEVKTATGEFTKESPSPVILAPPPIASVPPRTTPLPPASNGLLVLLVDDNDTNQMVASTMIKRRGHTVDIASNGQEAVEAVNKKAYDVIFMDCQMPVMDGVEATQKIREMEKSSGRHVPIVALTASALESDRERFKAAGMDDYLDKPIDQKALHACLERITELRKAA